MKMEFQELDVTIDKKGQVHIHVRGVAGEACLEITKDLEAILGNQLSLREFTSDYYDKPGNINQQSQQTQK